MEPDLQAPVGGGSAPAKASRGAPPPPPPPPPRKPSSRAAAAPATPSPSPKKPSSRGATPPTPPPPPPKKPASRGAAPPTPPPPPPKKPSSRGAAAPPPPPMPPSKKAPPSAPPPPPKKGGRGGPPAPPPPPGRKKMGPPAPPKNASSGQVNELPLTRRAFYKAIPDPKQGSHWSAAQLPELSAEDQRLCAEAFAASKPPVSKAQAPGKRVAPQSKAAVTDAPLLRCAEIVARQLIKPQAFPTPGHLLRALASNELDEEQVSCLKQLVRKMWAPECSSAMQGLKACKTPVEELTPTEALLYTLASVDRLPQMMATLELRRDFAALEATAAAKQSRVAEAHRRILESKRLEPSLQRVLVSGRFLNRGLESGKAKALAISSLLAARHQDLKFLNLVQVAHPSKLPYAMANLGEFMGYVLHKDLSTKGVSYSKGILSDELGDLQSAVGDIAGGRQDAVRAISLKLPAARDLLAHYQKLVQAGDIPLPAAEAPAAQHGSSRPALAPVEPGRLGSNITPVGQASGAAADQENHLTPTPGLYQLFLSHSEGLVASASAAEAKLRSEAAEIAEAEKQVLTRLGEKCEPDEIRQTFAALAEYITLIDAAYAKAAAESQRSQEKQPESAKEDAQAEMTKLIRSGIAKYRFNTDDEAESSEKGSC